MPSYGVLPGLPDDYNVQVIEEPGPAPSIRPLLNAQPLRIGQASLSDMPTAGWILLAIVALGAIGLLALAMTRK